MTEDEKTREENEKKSKALSNAYSELFSNKSKNGKLVRADLELFCGFRSSSMCERSPNALQTSFNEGKRRVYLRIVGMMDKGK